MTAKPKSPRKPPAQAAVRPGSRSSIKSRGQSKKAKPSVLPVLSRRALNRATLARQLLLERSPLSPLRAVETLVALQAQLAKPPFVALWSRLEGLRREQVLELLAEKRLVRATFVRATLHLMSAKDFLWMRPQVSPSLEDAVKVLRERAAGMNLALVANTAQTFLHQGPSTQEGVRVHLESKFPGLDVRAMGYVARTHLPLVQLPEPGRPWGYPPEPQFALAEQLVGEPLDEEAPVQKFVLRYLAAFGPASVDDMQSWTGLRGLKPEFEALRSKLEVFEDEHGTELFDLPKAPRPDEDTPAPVRLLPEFDTLVMAHQDRTRVVSDEHRKRIYQKANLRYLPTFLVDGFVAGTWRVDAKKSAASLTLQPFESLPGTAKKELEREAEGLLRFTEPEVKSYEVTFTKS